MDVSGNKAGNSNAQSLEGLLLSYKANTQLDKNVDLHA